MLFDLLLAEWHLPAPNLVVSLVGEERPFALKPWLRDVLRKGLVKAAQSTGGSGRKRLRGQEGQGAGVSGHRSGADGSGRRRVRAQASQGADRSGRRQLRAQAGQGAGGSGCTSEGRRFRAQVRGQVGQGAGMR